MKNKYDEIIISTASNKKKKSILLFSAIPSGPKVRIKIIGEIPKAVLIKYFQKEILEYKPKKYDKASGALKKRKNNICQKCKFLGIVFSS